MCANFLVQLYNSRNLLSEIIKNVKTLFILAARVNYRAVEIGSEQFNCFSINLQVVQTLSKCSEQTHRKRQEAAVMLLTREHCYTTHRIDGE